MKKEYKKLLELLNTFFKTDELDKEYDIVVNKLETLLEKLYQENKKFKQENIELHETIEILEDDEMRERLLKRHHTNNLKNISLEEMKKKLKIL